MSVLGEAAEKGPLAGTGRKDCREKFINQARRLCCSGWHRLEWPRIGGHWVEVAGLYGRRVVARFG